MHYFLFQMQVMLFTDVLLGKFRSGAKIRRKRLKKKYE